MKILIAEDDKVYKHLLETFLGEWGYDVISVSDGIEAWEIIRQADAPSLVISDWMMPSMSGPELCEKIRGMDKADYTYLILLTAKTDKKDVIKGLEAGADDFVTKPFDQRELKYRVKIGERIINLERRISHMAKTDFLTGILNRRAFMERIEEEISRSIRSGKIFSIIMSDIDHFKTINDTYGHQAGDQVLQIFSKKLSETIRPYDFIGRYGGEEFIVCLSDTGKDDAVQKAEKMRTAIEETKFMTGDEPSHTVKVTASFGVSSFMETDDKNVDLIIKRADDALYKAKSKGRNRVYLG
ncbi:diguanylate cyclase [Thermodesulfobacteriota bacterium]